MEETTPRMNPHHTLAISSLKPWGIYGELKKNLDLELENPLREIGRNLGLLFENYERVMLVKG